MNKRTPVAAIAAAAFSILSVANAAPVTTLDGSQGWTRTDMRGGGTADIVDVTGQGGNLEANAPAGSGMVLLTTGADNNDKAEIGIGGDFGTVGDFVDGGSLAYDYFKQSAGDLNGFAAPSLKLAVLDVTDTNGDGFAQFIFEPTWNVGTVGVSDQVPTDQWLTGTADGDEGIFWHTGIYGDPNQAGGLGKTMGEWLQQFSSLSDAVIIGISVGVGTFNQGQTGYFDDVVFANGNINLSADFEVASEIPVPAAFPLFAAGLGGLFAAKRRRNKA
jgi:hypothetical protein